MKYVSMLLELIRPTDSGSTLYAISNEGVVTATTFDTSRTERIGSTVYQQGGRRFAVHSSGSFICGSYDKNRIVRYQLDGIPIASYKIRRPQGMIAWNDGFLVVNEDRQLFQVDQDGLSEISESPVVSLFKLTDNLALLENEESFTVLGSDHIIEFEKGNAPVMSASILGQLLAVGYVGGGISIYNLDRAELINRIALPLAIWQAQALSFESDMALLVFGQTFKPSEERWIARIGVQSPGFEKVADLPFSSGLGAFVKGGCFCSKDGTVYTRTGTVLKKFDFLGG